MSYKPNHSIRIVTAASLFDGHDASINIMRRILQDLGAEVIHLGHNRSVKDVVEAALQEGAQGIAVSSYQGGHMEYFKYMRDLLVAAGAENVKIFGGGGGVIIHDEKRELEAYGITKIFHPDDGRRLGLEGMIELIIKECDFPLPLKDADKAFERIPMRSLGLVLNAVEAGATAPPVASFLRKAKGKPLVLGMTGTGGAGKSSLIDELLTRFLNVWPEKNIAVICVDPSKRKTGGALLGDRIRMNALSRSGTFMRSVASRKSSNEISSSLPAMLEYLKQHDFDLIIAETSGIGQASMAITEIADMSLYVMTSEFGAQSQLEKIEMIDYANFIAINKADRRGAEDALRDVRKQYGRARKLFNKNSDEFPVYLTQAAQFNDSGVNQLFLGICKTLSEREPNAWQIGGDRQNLLRNMKRQTVVPAERQSYLAEIAAAVRAYKKSTRSTAELASSWGALEKSKKLLPEASGIEKQIANIKESLADEDRKLIENWDSLREKYSGEVFRYQVRDKEIKQSLVFTSLSGTQIRKVCLPDLADWGDRLRFMKLENVPGEFPYTAGVFPLKREGEDPKRMFAGEGTPERTNRRFHYLCKGESSQRLSTAFDSVTLYGQDPDERPDIYGKIGESGVSVCTLEDMKKLYAGFDLCAPSTSVSMTINGPAPIVLAFFLNTAIDQQVEKFVKEKGRTPNDSESAAIRTWAQEQVRASVQADILKADQGENIGVFSIDFSLKMMGDMQEYFIENRVKNFYSVSISGYHIAEAGANPITQLALTLSNAFTYVEYYLARGMKVDDFAANLSFFFSNGLDPEYSVIGRVARRIWSVTMRNLYKANERSQKLKYHIQTSGRSLHAQEIDFNDIRTTLQALIAINDNCNSLHTNAFDEAITTPTEASVRRAMAIQMIIGKEFGVAKNENPMQGSYFFEELTDLVEEAVLSEFVKISQRGGVLGAMETQYQRGKIQEESLHYESLKHSGELPIVGVNTFIDPETLKEGFVPAKIEMARASQAEKQAQLIALRQYQERNMGTAQNEIESLKKIALSGGNVFAGLMTAARSCSLYQMSQALYEAGGQYRRNL